jgi:hypothetical protein
MPVQSLFTVGFQRTKSSNEIFWKLVTCEHTTPGAIQWNLLQLVTRPGCVGWGVEIPFPAAVVVVGGVVVELPMTPTHTFTLACMPVQSDLTVGFQRTKSSKEIFWKLVTWEQTTPGALMS